MSTNEQLIQELAVAHRIIDKLNRELVYLQNELATERMRTEPRTPWKPVRSSERHLWG